MGPADFAEWFSHIEEEAATAALGEYDDGAYLAGEELEQRLEQIEVFLKEYFPESEG